MISQAALERTINALDDVPRTVREIHQRVDLWSPQTIAVALRDLVGRHRAIAFEEPGCKSVIIRKRYRRVP